MRKKKFLIFGVLALSAFAVAGVGYIRSIDFDQYRPALADELRAATGRDVEIEGRVALSLLPRPRFRVSGVAIANAPWGTRNVLARIARVDADIALLPLLKGERRISRVRLVQPDFWFETDAVGKVNWILAGPMPEAGGKAETGDGGLLLGALDIRRIDITGGRITYRDGVTGDITVLSVKSASVEGDGYSAPMAMAFAGEWDAFPIELHGVVGPFNAVSSDAGVASAVNLRVAVGGARVSVDGTVGDPHTGPGAALRLSASVDEFEKLGRRFGIALPLAERVALDADVRYRQARLEVTDATLKVGKQAMSASASVNFAPARPVFTADLQAPEIDLGRPAAGAGPVEGMTAAAAGAFAPIETLVNSGLLTLADGTVAIRADILRAGGGTLRDVNASLAVSGGGLVVDPIRAQSVAGALEGSIRVDTATSPARVAVSVKAPAFAAGPLLQRLGSIKAFGGVASVAANLTTVAGPPEAMLAALEGEALLAMGEGRLTLEPYNGPFDEHVRGPGSLVGLLAAEGHEDVAIECVAGRVAVMGGIARSEGFVLLSEDARVKGEGRLDLKTGELALQFIPESLSDSGKGKLLIGQPVSVNGPLGAPTVAREAAPRRGLGIGDAAFYPLRRFFAGLAANPSANACLRALPPVPRKRRLPGQPIAQRPVQDVPATVSPPAPQPVGTISGQAE